MKILVTGSSGFVGQHLLEMLKTKGLNFDTLHRNGSELIRLSRDGEHIPLNYKVDTVIHLAGLAHSDNRKITDREYFEANCDYAITVAELMSQSGMRRLIFLSSASVYGVSSSHSEVSEDSIQRPVDAYGKSKLMAEEELNKRSKSLGFELLVFRPALIYGRNAKGNIDSLTELVRKLPVIPIGQSKNKRSFLNVDKLNSVLLKATDYPLTSNEVINIADRPPISTTLLIKNLAKNLDKQVKVISFPRILWKFLLVPLGKRKLYEQLFCDLVLDTHKLTDFLSRQPADGKNSAEKLEKA